MNGVQGDIQSVGEFMRMYVARNNRELSPLFIAGESYGTFRAAGLAGYLIDRGIAFNGIVLIGTTLNLETIWSRSDDLVYQLLLAHLRRRRLVSQEGRGRSAAEGSEVVSEGSGRFRAWANMRPRSPKATRLLRAERKAIIDKLVRYTGLEARYIEREQSALRRLALHARVAARQSTSPSGAMMAA